MNYEGQAKDERDLHVMLTLFPGVNQLLSHHLNNSLNIVINGIEAGKYDIAKKAAEHMLADLKKFGI